MTAVLVALPAALGAQVVPGAGAGIGTETADRARILEDIGRASDTEPDSVRRHGLRAISPTVRLVWSSNLPADGNDGALWAGRGASGSVSGGVAYTTTVRSFRLTTRFEPIATASQNRPFTILPGRAPDRSAFSSPWHFGVASADLPLRFGDEPLYTAGLGQSSITLERERVAFGASNADEWWGPAQRNTLVLSNNAAGIPRLFVRTTRPIATRFGALEGRLFVGGLTESPYFDRDPSNDVRSANGLLVTLRPPFDSGLTLGLSRLVIRPTSAPLEPLAHALDVFVRWSRVDPSATAVEQGTDQLISVFARWIFPASGMEAYVEWARAELPISVRELLETPQRSQGYTLGLQWIGNPAASSHLRLRGEVTDLEQTAAIPGRETLDYYTGTSAVQGFTQRGQVLGAAIGPGASSQFLGGDWIAPGWAAGAHVARVRTENDALYRQNGPLDTRHDVTVEAGLHAGLRTARSDIAAELVAARRYNYLFQSNYYLGAPVQALDVRNAFVRVTVSPR